MQLGSWEGIADLRKETAEREGGNRRELYQRLLAYGMRYCLTQPQQEAVELCCIQGLTATQAAQQLGRLVPGDIAVVGFDNSTMSQYTSPPITSMEIPREGIAKSAVEMLQQMIEQGEIPQPVTYSTRLIERASTSL